jgi:hypothetical protein
VETCFASPCLFIYLPILLPAIEGGHGLVIQGKAGNGKRRLQVQSAADEDVLTCRGLVFLAELGNFPSFSGNWSSSGHFQFSSGWK